jgi:beta-phosphoglucomutase
MIRGILFDFDGVIADTLPTHYLAWKHVFERYGGSIPEKTILLHEGRKSREVLPILLKESGVRIPEEDYDRFIEEKRAHYRAISRPVHYPKAFETVETLKRRGFAVALVTASARRNVQAVLGDQRRSRFDLILTGEDVRQAKPFPEPYLTAAGRMGLAPEDCAVIENAPLGIEAAKSAGMYCIAIASTLERRYLNRADLILETIGELVLVPLLGACPT